MSLTSYSFFIFCGIIFLLYYTVCRKFQWQLLLVASIMFYASFSLSYLLVLGYVTIVSYIAAVLIGNTHQDVGKPIEVLSVFLLLLALGIFKYTVFIFGNIDAMAHTQLSAIANIILPVGLSFYTFQAISYVVDVYRGEYEPERNVLRHLLYISFFPQILQGPISGYVRIKNELFSIHEFKYDDGAHGTRRFVWGLFKKLVIANRIEVVIAPVFSHYTEYGGFAFWIVLILYAIEIYADFSGYMDIMIGFSGVLGIRLTENFDTPYFAKSAAEFWRRWHMSLGDWFRNYLFYPIMRSKKIQSLRKRLKADGKKNVSRTLPTVIALAAVWLSTGIWHGASWTYVAWGGYYGTIIIFSTCMEKSYLIWRDSHKKLFESTGFQLFRIVRTFFITVLSYSMFRAESLTSTGYILKKLFTRPDLSTAYRFIMSNKLNLVVVSFGSAIFFICDIVRYKNDLSMQTVITKLPTIIRWGLYLAFILIIILLGSFEKGAFLYFEF